MSQPEILLVIPTYRDGASLAEFLPLLCEELGRDATGAAVQVVDDGSPLAEQIWLTAEVDRLRREYSNLRPLLTHSVNRGKGRAIRTGWSSEPRAPWLAFADADGAAPATEVCALVNRARQTREPALLIAVRAKTSGKPVARFWHRKIGSWMFNVWVRYWLKFDLPDTQCGLKVIPGPFYAGIDWREDGFAFDLELLLRARASELPVISQPIAWTERAGSSLGFGSMIGLFIAVWRLRPRMAK